MLAAVAEVDTPPTPVTPEVARVSPFTKPVSVVVKAGLASP